MKMHTGVIATALLSLCSSAHASYISMVTDFSVVETSTGLDLVVGTENKGDEPSYGVQFEAQAGDKQFTSAQAPRLAVDEKISERFPIGDAFGLPGQYPIVIKTHYKDGNAYRFSALTVGFYDHEEPVLSKILMRSENADVPVNSAGTISVEVHNTDSVQHDLDVVLHLPNELAADPRQHVQLAPGAEATLHFEVENFSALENSSYAVAFIAQHEDGERHYSTSAPSVVRITATVTLTSNWIWVFGGAGAAVLVLLFIVIRSRAKRSRS